MRDALQVREVGEVSQRGGQGGDALVGEVVVAQAARARGRGGGSREVRQHQGRATVSERGIPCMDMYGDSRTPHSARIYCIRGSTQEGCARTPISMTHLKIQGRV